MLRRIDVPFRVRHQTENATAGVADTCHVGVGAIRVVRERQHFILHTALLSPGIANCQTALLSQLVQDFTAGGDKLAFRMSHRQVHPLDLPQEDARCLTWTGHASVQLRWDAQELKETAALKMRFSVAKAPTGPITLSALGEKAKGPIDLVPTMKLAEGKGMRDLEVPLSCIADGAISGIELASGAAFVFELETISVVPQAAQMDCTGPF